MDEARWRQALQVAQSNFQAEAQLRRSAEGELERVVAEVIAMAYLLLGPELAGRVSRGERSLRDLPAVEMVRQVKMAAYEKLAQAQTGVQVITGIAPNEAMQLEERVRHLEAENRALRGQLVGSAERVEDTRPAQSEEEVVDEARADTPNQNQTTPEGVSRFVTPVPAAVDPDLLPLARSLLQEQKDKLDERVQGLIRVLAQGTECRQPRILESLEAQGLGSGGTLYRRVEWATEDLGLTEVVETKGEISGRSPNLLRLTPLGLAVARLLLGRDPAVPLLDRLMARHKSPEHTLLNLEAADLLWAAGGAVDLFPAPVELPGGGRLDVDLVWSLKGSTHYVECERETVKREAQRAKKWHNLSQATSDFWIVVPDPSAQKALRNEITTWAIAGRYAIDLHLTNLTQATAETPWLYERTIRPSR